jgi:hypothetical protein
MMLAHTENVSLSSSSLQTHCECQAKPALPLVLFYPFLLLLLVWDDVQDRVEVEVCCTAAADR